MSSLRKIYENLCMTSVFSGVLAKPLFVNLFDFFEKSQREEKIKAYARFVGEIYKNGTSLTETVLRYVFEDENVYVKSRAGSLTVDPSVAAAVERELSVFEEFSSLIHCKNNEPFLDQIVTCNKKWILYNQQ